MKQRILLSCAFLAVISLAAFGFINKEEKKPDPVKHCNNIQFESYFNDLFHTDEGVFEFAYDIGPRFMSNITKEKLDKAQSVADIMPSKDEKIIVSYYNVAVNIYHEDRNLHMTEKGENGTLTTAQKQRLQALEYGNNFYLTGNSERKYSKSGKIFADTLVHYFTVVPHKHASYASGKEDLITYLKEQSKEAIFIARKSQIQPGKISFKITKEGTLEQAKLTNTCGFNSIDEKMLELIQQLPGEWEAATNEKGQKVEQELVFFFGSMGC